MCASLNISKKTSHMCASSRNISTSVASNICATQRTQALPKHPTCVQAQELKQFRSIKHECSRQTVYSFFASYMYKLKEHKHFRSIQHFCQLIYWLYSHVKIICGVLLECYVDLSTHVGCYESAYVPWACRHVRCFFAYVLWACTHVRCFSLGLHTCWMLRKCLCSFGLHTCFMLRKCLCSLGLHTCWMLRNCLCSLGLHTCWMVRNCSCSLGFHTCLMLRKCLCSLGLHTRWMFFCLCALDLHTCWMFRTCLCSLGLHTCWMLRKCLCSLGLHTRWMFFLLMCFGLAHMLDVTNLFLFFGLAHMLDVTNLFMFFGLAHMLDASEVLVFFVFAHMLDDFVAYVLWTCTHVGCYGTAYVRWVCTHVGWSETAHVLWVFTHVWCYWTAYVLCVRTHVACYAVRLNKLGQRCRTKLGQSALARLTAGQKSMAENSCFLPTFQHVIPWTNCQCHRILNICIFQQYPNIDPKNIVFIKPNVNTVNNVFEIDDSSTAASQAAALRVATLIRSRNQGYCIVHWNCAASRIGFEDHERQPVDFRPSYIIFSELGRRSISAVLQTITCERSNVVQFFFKVGFWKFYVWNNWVLANTAVLLPEQS